MISVSTNTTALTAQRYLNANSSAASSSIAKMSSGSRIVKASDDAASLAISNKLRADIASLQQANSNASQGGSLLQVASGGLVQVGDILTRMKTLSTQVVNGTLSTSERQFAQQEFGQLVTQVGSIASQTRVNGNAILAGGDKVLSQLTKVTQAGNSISAGTTTLTANGNFGVGAVTLITGQVEGVVKNVTTSAVGQSTQIDITIGTQTFRGIVDSNAAAGTEIEMRDVANDRNGFRLTTSTAALGGAAAIQTELRALFNLSSLTAASVQFNAGALTQAAGADFLNDGETTYGNIISASGATTAGAYTVTTKFTAGDVATGAVESIEFRLQGEDGTVYSSTITDGSGTVADGVLMEAGTTRTLRFGNGVELTVDDVAVNAMDTAPIGDSDARAVRFEVNNGAATTLTFQVGGQSTDTLTFSLDSMTTSSLGIDSLNIETVAGGQAASDAIDIAISKVNTLTANVGALQSRLEYIQNNLSTVTENIQAANGVFKDVDMAKEMTNFTKSNTLAQAGISMLSQANQMPSLLLRLLQ